MGPYMFSNVLVQVDGSEASRRALEAALSLCEATRARLTVLAAQGRLPAYAATVGEVDDAKRAKDELFSSVLDEAQVMASYEGIPITTDLVTGPVVRAVSEYAESHAHDLIVLGNRTRVLGRWMPGSIAAGRAPCSLPGDDRPMRQQRGAAARTVREGRDNRCGRPRRDRAGGRCRATRRGVRRGSAAVSPGLRSGTPSRSGWSSPIRLASAMTAMIALVSSGVEDVPHTRQARAGRDLQRRDRRRARADGARSGRAAQRYSRWCKRISGPSQSGTR